MTYIDHNFDPDTALTRHELGQLADYQDGLRQMASFEPAPRVPPPFPLRAYLALVHAEP